MRQLIAPEPPYSAFLSVPGVKETWYTRSADVVLEFWETRRDEGLTNKEVAVRREKFGYNEMTAKASTPWWKMLLTQFRDFMVLVLLCTAQSRREPSPDISHSRSVYSAWRASPEDYTVLS